MKKNFGKKTWLYPMPVFVLGTYNENNVANAMVAAWGGVYDTNQVAIALALEHKTVANLKLNNAFTLSIADKFHVKEVDYLGIVSQNDEVNKVEKAKLSVVKSEFVNAPIFDDFKMVLECVVHSFNEETGILIGNIINVKVDEDVLNDNKIDLSKLCPITYDSCSHNYNVVGEVVGKAFKDGYSIK